MNNVELRELIEQLAETDEWKKEMYRVGEEYRTRGTVGRDRKYFVINILDENVMIFPGKKVESNLDYKVEVNHKGRYHHDLVFHMKKLRLFARKNNCEEELKEELFNLLKNINSNGLDINLNDYPILEKISKIASKVTFDSNYNYVKGDKIIPFADEKYSFKEFIILLCLVLLQEDINYPIEEGYEGRLMCLHIYYSTIYSDYNEIDSIAQESYKKTTKSRRKFKSVNYDKFKEMEKVLKIVDTK